MRQTSQKAQVSSKRRPRTGSLPSVGALIVLGLSVIAGAQAAAAQPVEVFGEVAKLVSTPRVNDEAFGSVVALQGDRAVIGTEPLNNASLTGSAYVLERQPDGSWLQTARLLSADAAPEDFLGSAVALDGDRIAVGARVDDDTGFNSGSVYIFELDANGAWIEVAKLTSSNGQVFGFFGVVLSLDGDRLVVGADGEGTAGSVYVFERQTDGTWQEVASVGPGDAPFSFYGRTLEVEGDRLVVGALGEGDGAAYVYDRQPDGSWPQVAKLEADSDTDNFATSLSLDGDQIAVGAEFDDLEGAAFLFERDPGGNWSQSTKLEVSDSSLNDQFGNSIALEGDLLVVGAKGEDAEGNNSGGAYIFERNPTGDWLLIDRIESLDVAANDFFGFAVALDNRRILVGASEENGERGAAYVFDAVQIDPSLTIAGSCPGDITLTYDGMTPRDNIQLFGSANLGAGTIEEGPCAGTPLELNSAAALRVWTTDETGAGVLARSLSSNFCGAYLQLLDERTCLLSSPMQLPTQ